LRGRRAGRKVAATLDAGAAFVAKLQRAGNRSSARPAVDETVNMRWNEREHAANGRRNGLFLLSFFDPSVVDQKALAKRCSPYYALCSSGTSTQDVVDFDSQEKTGRLSPAITPNPERRLQGNTQRSP
jgi:hypothetical protein